VGKEQPVHIYELLGKKGQLGDAKMKAVSLYEEALGLYWERKWNEAIACLAEALKVKEDDSPSRELMRRVDEYRENPPQPGWRGEYTRTVKD
jgi:adenylate cyclase